jgi:hypothetical protein
LQNLCQKYNFSHSYLASILDLHRDHALNLELSDASDDSGTDLVEMGCHDPDDLRPYREHSHPRIDLTRKNSQETFNLAHQNYNEFSTIVGSRTGDRPDSKKRPSEVSHLSSISAVSDQNRERNRRFSIRIPSTQRMLPATSHHSGDSYQDGVKESEIKRSDTVCDARYESHGIEKQNVELSIGRVPNIFVSHCATMRELLERRNHREDDSSGEAIGDSRLLTVYPGTDEETSDTSLDSPRDDMNDALRISTGRNDRQRRCKLRACR